MTETTRKRILLINPLVGDDYEFSRVNRPMPLGLLSLAAMLVERYQVRILDQRMDPDFYRLFKEEIATKPLFVGTHVMGGPQIRKAMDLSDWIKRISDVPVVWGGAFPTMVPEAAAGYRSVDYVIRGEGEIPVLALADALAEGKALGDVPSLTYESGGEISETALAPQPDLNELPSLPVHLLDLKHYDWSAGINQKLDGLKLQMESSRGCLSHCIFCYNPFFYQNSWRGLTARKTVDWMEILVRSHGAIHIDIIDDSFFEDLQRVRDFANEILARKLEISYLLNGGKVGPILDMADEDLAALKKSGCQTIHLGAESGSDRVLQKIAKGITSDQIRRSNLKLKKAGIRPSYYFISGAPGEEEEDLRQSISTMFGLLHDNPDTKIIAAFSFTPFARTPGFKIAQSYGMPTPVTLQEWSNYDTLNTLQPWLSRKRQRDVQLLFFFAMFIDKKIEDLSQSTLIRLFARLYRPIARFRVKRLWLGWAVEEKIGMAFLSWISRRQTRKILSIKD